MDNTNTRNGNQIYVDVKTRKLISGRQVEFFTPHEWSILNILWNYMPRPARRDELIVAIWGDDSRGKRTRAVDVHIASIRKKLTRLDAGSIDSIYGYGYQYVSGRKKLVFEGDKNVERQ